MNGIPKYAGEAHQSLHIDDKEYTIPRKTMVFVNNAALQTRPQYWGTDSLIFRPDRWIQKLDDGSEVLVHPIEGSYVPWVRTPFMLW